MQQTPHSLWRVRLHSPARAAHVHAKPLQSLNEDQALHNGIKISFSRPVAQRIYPFLAFSGQHDEQPAISAAFVLFVTVSFNMQLAKSAAKQRGICITTLTALELVDQFIGK